MTTTVMTRDLKDIVRPKSACANKTVMNPEPKAKATKKRTTVACEPHATNRIGEGVYPNGIIGQTALTIKTPNATSATQVALARTSAEIVGVSLVGIVIVSRLTRGLSRAAH